MTSVPFCGGAPSGDQSGTPIDQRLDPIREAEGGTSRTAGIGLTEDADDLSLSPSLAIRPKTPMFR